jgi:hypothetical protein
MIRSQHHSCWELGFTTKTQKATILHSPGGAFCNSLRASSSGEHGSCDFESIRIRSADASEVRALSHHHSDCIIIVGFGIGRPLPGSRFGSGRRAPLSMAPDSRKFVKVPLENMPWFRCPPLPGRGVKQGEVFKAPSESQAHRYKYYTY